jgi:ribosomal protein S27E
MIECHKVNCPKCGKELAKPDKKLENTAFFVAHFTCDCCGTTVKYATEF